MSHLKEWENSLRFGSNSVKKNNGLQIGHKFLRHNSKHQRTFDRCEVNGKTKIRFDFAANAVTPAIKQIGSKLPTNRHNDCLDDELQESTIAENYATYLKAFALIYVLPEEEWRADNIDKLLVEGDELFQASGDGHSTKKTRKKSCIYCSDEQRIKRHFQLEGHNFTLELRSPYMGDITKPADLRPPHILKNLKQVLRIFFHKAYYCLLLHKSGNLLLWRRRQLYFAMEMKRERTDGSPSSRLCVAMLVCLTNLDNVVHLITNLSGDNPNGAFRIRELAVVRLVTPDGRTFMRDTNKRSLEYHVINNSYAYLKSNLHLSLNPKEALRNGSSIIVGVSVIIASRIEHPASWNTYILDRLICYGIELYRCCWKATAKDRRPIDLDTFPTQLRIGQFVAEIKLLPKVGTGRFGSTQVNDFELEIRGALKEYGNTLFQIDNQIYAIWCKDEFFYVMDPYRHVVVSPHFKRNSIKLSKWATVRMFRDITSMINVFDQQLRESNRKSTFYLHALRIKNIAKCPAGFALKPTRKNDPALNATINESIEFPLKLDKCEKILLEVSDYEPDLSSTTEETFAWEDVSAKDTPAKTTDVKKVGVKKCVGSHPRVVGGLDVPVVYQKDAELCAEYRPLKIGQQQLTTCNQCESSRKFNSDASHITEPKNSVCDNQAFLTYPVYTKNPFNLAIAGSESGTMESLNRLLDSAFRLTSRVFTITPWGNYVVFQQPVVQTDSDESSKMFYLFEGCTCNIDRFRHLDLSHGTAGLISFQTQSQVVCYMIDSRETRALRALGFHVDKSTTHNGTCPARGT